VWGTNKNKGPNGKKVRGAGRDAGKQKGKTRKKRPACRAVLDQKGQTEERGKGGQDLAEEHTAI